MLHTTETKLSNSKEGSAGPINQFGHIVLKGNLNSLFLYGFLTLIASAAVSHAGTSGVVAPAVGKTNVKDDNKCVMCEFVMQFLRNMLEQKDTRVRMLES